MSDLIIPPSRFRIPTSVPKYLLQGPLFPATKTSKISDREQRLKLFDGTELWTRPNGFTQYDLALSLAYKKLFVKQDSIENIAFTLGDFARALNRADGGKNRDLMLAAFHRSKHFALGFEDGKACFDGLRLGQFVEIEQNRFHASFNLDYIEQFYEHPHTISYLDIDFYLSLPLGLLSWLYGFICSEPHLKIMGLGDVHYFSGSNYRHSRFFKKAVKKALDVLFHRGVIKWRHGVTRDDVVYWDLIPFEQQKRGHIIDKEQRV